MTLTALPPAPDGYVVHDGDGGRYYYVGRDVAYREVQRFARGTVEALYSHRTFEPVLARALAAERRVSIVARVLGALEEHLAKRSDRVFVAPVIRAIAQALGAKVRA